MRVEDLYEDLDENTKDELTRIAVDIKSIRRDKNSNPILDQYGAEIPSCNIILLLGAAIHYQPPEGFEECYPKIQSPPQVNELRDLIIDQLIPPEFENRREQNKRWKEDNWPLSWIAQYYEDSTSRLNLLDKLSSWIDNDKKPSPLVKALAEMPFRYIITTNYDCLFEDALSLADKKKIHKGIYRCNKLGKKLSTDNVSKNEISNLTPFIFKLHGDIRDVQIDANAIALKDRFDLEKDSIVLTDEDYIHFILRMSEKKAILENYTSSKPDASINDFDKPDFDLYPIPRAIFEAFYGIENKTFLFVGYGMRDYNLRLIFKSSLWGDTPIKIANQLKKWSVAKKADEPIKRIFQKDYNLTFIERDAWSVIPYLYKQVFNKEMPL